jgi:hypothetical protein
MWEKLCNLSKPLAPYKGDGGVYNGPDSFKASDYMIHLVNPGKLRVLKASQVDQMKIGGPKPYVKNNQNKLQ